MTRDEFEAQISAIGALEDPAQIRTQLTELQASVLQDYDAHAEAIAERDRLTGDNESLRAANMKLFLQVGSKRKPEETGAGADDNTPRKYEDLFDEKGDLK